MYSPYYNEEVWVDIIDFPGYQVSNTGKITLKLSEIK
jgi:hypothetical protein